MFRSVVRSALNRNAPLQQAIKGASAQSYAIVSVEKMIEREQNKRLEYEKELLGRVLTNTENEYDVSSDLQALTALVNSREDFIELMQMSAQMSGKLSNLGHKDVGLMLKKPVARIAVTGAAGQIGYSLLPRIASGEMLGPQQPVILHLIERPEAIKALQGVVMELEDCAFPLLRGIKITSDMDEGFDKVDYALLVGAKPRGPGMERGDLLKDNGAIFRDVGRALDRKANKNVRTVVVGNPANTNALVASANAPNIDPKQFSALTRLDHDRALAQIALRLGVPLADIKKVAIWGNHSATQVPDITNATIAGKSVKELINDDKWIGDTFIPTVQKRGAAIIDARGASSAASAADATIKHMRDWALGSNGEWVSMAVLADGSYGIKDKIYTSYPVVCQGDGKYEVVQGLTLDKDIQSRLKKSVQELLDERKAVDALLKAGA